MISGSRRDSVGGGVVAEFIRDLGKPTRFSGGGGSSRILLISQSLRGSVGGGGCGRIVPLSPVSWVETHILLNYDDN